LVALQTRSAWRDPFRTLLRNPYAWVVLIAFTLRLVTLSLYPLTDTTEARYSEIARKMVETGNVITPQFDYGVPFWGKPPLSTWIRAASFKVFGINEFAARLPSILIALLIVALVFYLARQQRCRNTAWIASAMLSTSALFFILSGAVLMDPVMTLGTTLSMVAFWQAMKDRGRYWGYLFFVGLAIGLMAKGPVAAVLTSIPIVVWLSVSGNWKCGWQRIPLFSGTLLMLALSLPWYLLAELATPGFLEYFILGEHWNRFVQPGWSGDLYGTAHTSQVGAIWVDWLAAAFPLSIILIVALFILIWRKKFTAIRTLREDWNLYLILWIITPMVFFTFSGNILATYVLPGMPAAALLAAGFWQAKPGSRRIRKSIAVITAAGAVLPLLLVALIFFYVPKIADQRSEKFLVDAYQQANNSAQGRLLYLYVRPFSAEFYSRGKAEVMPHTNQMRDLINNESSVFFAVPVDYVSHIPENIQHCLDRIEQYGRHVLYRGKSHSGVRSC